jgi:drug/metabolite transporter (DMT)-like permease
MKHYASPLFLGYGFIFLSAVLFGTYGVWSRLMGDVFAPFYQTWVRSLIILALMIPFMLKAKSFRKIKRNDWPAVGIYIAFCLFTQAPLYYAFNHAPIGAVHLSFFSTFVITAYLIGQFYLGERITNIKVVSMVLAFVGLAFVVGGLAIPFALLGLALAALNGIASGGEVATSKKVSSKYPPALLVFWGWVFTVLTHLPLSLLLGEKQVMPEFNTAWLWLVIFAIVNAVAFWLIIVGFRSVDASIGSLIGLLEAVFSVLFGALIFREAMPLSVYVGGAIILIAAGLPDVFGKHLGKKIIRQ